MARRHLGLDARLYGAGRAGLGRYTAELVRALAQLVPDWRLTAFIQPDGATRRELQSLGVTTVSAPYRPYSFAEQRYLPRLLRAAKLDLMHFPHFNVPLAYRQPYVVTIHDLILHHFPSRQTSQRRAPVFWSKYLVYRLAVRRVISRARRIIAVSHYTAEDLLTFYPRAAPRVRVVPEPASVLPVAAQPDRSGAVAYTMHSPYLLVVGNYYPHKNLRRLLDCWARVHRQLTHQLVFVGREDAFTETLKDYARSLGLLTSDASSSVRFLGFVSDERLVELYRGAEYYLCPSRYEGVGLPGVEAIALGTPTLSSPAAALPETYGRAATYLPVHDVTSFARSLMNLLAHPTPQTDRPHPPVRVSTGALARQLEDCYEEAITGRAPHRPHHER